MTSDSSDERIGLGIAAAAVVGVFAVAALAGSPTVDHCSLPAAAGEQAEVDAVPHLLLPDSGGLLVNGQPLALSGLEPRMREILAAYAPSRRVVFVFPASAARCADVAYVARAVRAAGGTAYDWARTYPELDWRQFIPPAAPATVAR